jgi:hypothetical protein
MEHEEAVQMQAAMRYALRELTLAERDSFEEHYADCSYCMADVELATAFAANAEAVFRDRALPEDRPKRFAWLPWRPLPALVFSAALNLVLVGALGYSILSLPHARIAVDQPAELESVEIVPVHGTTRGSEGAAQVVQASRRPIVLTFDLPQHYEHYYYSIDQAGAEVLSGEVSIAGQPDSLNLRIPVARMSPGEYQVTLTGTIGAARESLGACLLQVQNH